MIIEYFSLSGTTEALNERISIVSRLFEEGDFGPKFR